MKHHFPGSFKTGKQKIKQAEISADQFDAMLNIQQNILYYIAQDRNENEILDEICTLSEGMLDDAIAGIMLLDPSDQSMSIISAPSLSEQGRSALCDIQRNMGDGACTASVYQSSPCSADEAGNFNICSCWSMPVYNSDAAVIGSFSLSFCDNRAPSTFHERLLKMCSSAVSILLERKELKKLSVTDKLTGLWNRVKLDQVLHEQRANHAASNETYSVMIIDIDNFKHINDTFGHNAGDRVLVDIASVLRDHVRPQDLVGRWGGEEFMVILPNTTESQALAVGESIRKATGSSHCGVADCLTVSIGVCEVTENLRALEVVDRADRALYKAKSSGRDCVCNFMSRASL